MLVIYRAGFGLCWIAQNNKWLWSWIWSHSRMQRQDRWRERMRGVKKD